MTRRALPVVNDRDSTEAWMERLGAKFVDILFIRPSGEREYQNHVDDPKTLSEVVQMELRRIGKGGRAIVPVEGGWCVFNGTRSKTFPNQEAAEMYAIHVSG